MTKLTDDDVVDLVNQELGNAMGGPGGDIANDRALAFSYYNREPFGNEEHAISKVVTSDVMEVVDGIMPSMMRLFTSQDNLLEFDAHGPEDEPAAEQESDYVSYLFFKRNPAFEILFFWTFDALLQKNGYVKVFWDDYEEITNETYEGLSEAELESLLDDDELEAIERDERQAETVDNDGNVGMGTVHDVKFKRVRTKGTPRVVNVPPEEFRISADARSTDPSQAKMVAHERFVKRDELYAMGFDKKIVDELPAESVTAPATDGKARRNKSDDHKQSSTDSKDKAGDNIKLTEAYISVDQDDDGRAELKQVFIANGAKIEVNDSDRQPFHCISASPLPHKHFGLCPGEKVMDNQLITSTLLRQMLDNLYHTNNPGHGVWEQGIGEGTMEALLTRRVGAVTTFQRPVGESYAPMTVPFTADASFPMLAYFDKVKRDRTGVNSDAEGLDPAELKHIQQSVMASSHSISKGKIELIARIFAETGFKTLFLHFHELTLKHQQDAEIVKLRNGWTQVNPQEWRTRKDMTVGIGLGIGTREQNLIHLDSIKEIQKEMVAGGGMNVTVTPKHLFNTASEFVKNANLKRPEMFFRDPGNEKGAPPSSEQDAIKKKEQQLLERQQQLDAERNKINEAKLQLEAKEQDVKAQLEVMKLREKTEEREDKWAAANEKLRTEITELRLKAEDKDEDRRLQEIRVAAEVEESQERSRKTRAETAKILAETEGIVLETDATEAGVTKLLENDDESEES